MVSAVALAEKTKRSESWSLMTARMLSCSFAASSFPHNTIVVGRLYAAEDCKFSKNHKRCWAEDGTKSECFVVKKGRMLCWLTSA